MLTQTDAVEQRNLVDARGPLANGLSTEMAKVQGGLLVFLIVVLPPVEMITAVSPGCVNCTH